VTEAPRYVSFRDYLRVIRERRWLVLFVTLLITGPAAVAAEKSRPFYRAEVALEFLSVNQQTSTFGLFQDPGG
jgi:uncharacterized protein involved in exopolysaccharide biosynthesis